MILLGILRYAKLFGDEEAVCSVEKYWQQVNDTQIRNTGNGTMHELWSERGNACRLLGAGDKPNETCVAVGWMELSLTLFYLKQDVKYLDAIDKTLYNHMLASISSDGTDFAYYQPNFGKKIKTTDSKMYKCCRYRGLTVFTYMDEMLYYEDDTTVIPMIYTSGNYQSSDVYAVMETQYPYEDSVRIKITSCKDKVLKLRVPENYEVSKFVYNSQTLTPCVLDGYIDVKMQKDILVEIELIFAGKVNVEHGMIHGQEYMAFSYGCVLLAAKGVCEGLALKRENLDLKKEVVGSEERLTFSVDGSFEGRDTKVLYCEYSAADDYSVWMPVK